MTTEPQKTLLTLPLGDTSNWSFTGTESKAAFPGGPYWVRSVSDLSWTRLNGRSMRISKEDRQFSSEFLASLTMQCQSHVLCKTDWERLFSRVCSDSSRGSGFRLKGDEFRWDATDAAFYSEGDETLEQDFPLKRFSARLDGALSSLISEKCHHYIPQYIACNSNHSMIPIGNTTWRCEKQTKCVQMGGDSHLSILTSSF